MTLDTHQLDTLLSSVAHRVAGRGYTYTIDRILIDSRSPHADERSLFVAVRTATGDGHRYIGDLYARGVRTFLVEDADINYSALYPQGLFYLAHSSIEALQSLAGQYLAQRHCDLVAITGSNGKTIVKEMLYSLLYLEYHHIARSPGSYNSQIGVPLSVLTITEDTDLALIEVGISKPREMQVLEQLLHPHRIVLTGVGSTHSENFSSTDELLAEKLSLASDPTAIVYTSADDPRILSALEKRRQPYIAYTLVGNPKAKLSASIDRDGTHALLTIHYLMDDGMHILHLRPPFADHANISNLLLALTVIYDICPKLLVSPHLTQAVERLRPIEMRLEVKESLSGSKIINDSYSSDLESLHVALEALYRLTPHEGNSGVVLTDIEQSALSDTELYKAVYAELIASSVRHVYLVGSSRLQHLATHCQAGTHAIGCSGPFDTAGELLSQCRTELLRHDTLLIKGARRYHLEHLVGKLSKQENQTVLEVNLSALVGNYSFYRSRLPQSAQLVCMIKADAYGLGASEVAYALEQARADYLAVAMADEGKMLRMRGITAPIIVMNPTPSTLGTCAEHQLDFVVYSDSMLAEVLEFIDWAHDALSAPLRIHLKVDSGMHRLGFRLEDLPLLERSLSNTMIRVVSIFSHLAGADEARLDEFTHAQAQYLDQFYWSITALIPSEPRPRRHLLNTAGLERFHHVYPLDGGRLGIGLYGSSPTLRKEVRPVARLITRIIQTKLLDRGDSVGYGCHGQIDRPTRIAILPIGYADGFSRRYGRGAYSVSLRGVLCPTIGNICMDTCMIDITAVPEATEQDEVVIFGDALTPLEKMASVADTITYEILTGISPRVRRIYIRE